MRLETLRNLYVNQLREVYSAEKQIVVGLTKMAAAASNSQLQQAFKQHQVESENQIKRLDQIFSSLGESSSGETSKALMGLITEGQEVIASSGEADVIDAGLIGAAQKIEHYEIACYGTLIAYAKLLRDTQAEKLLQQTLNEEYATDRKLTILAEGMVNARAVQAAGNYREGSSEGLSLTSILMGAAAGVAVGMLLAPGTGNESRRKIMEGANSLLDQFGGQFGGLADTVRTTISQLTGQGQDQNASKATNGNGNGSVNQSTSQPTTPVL